MSKLYESSLQRACVSWFRLQYPQYRRSFFAIPNGGFRTIRNRITLAKEGVLAGVSDLFLAVPNKEYSGLFIELKYGKNKLTGEQEEFLNNARNNKYRAEVIKSFDEFRLLIQEYFT